MTDATEPVGVSFPRPPMKTLFEDRYFVSGSGLGSGIAKLFKDRALLNRKHTHLHLAHRHTSWAILG